MNDEHAAIRDQQRETWNKFSSGWKKWDGLTNDFLRPVREEMISAIRPSGKDHVLDVAAGTGEPGLTIAAMLNGGKVMLTDLAEDMLKITRETAARRGLNNVETKTCDACELPFDDNSFDAISCGFGFMFFPEMQQAANEMYRVLKPGGRIATAVWDVPAKNAWVTTVMGSIKKHVELPTPPPGAPGMFRCSEPGQMQAIFEKAGFKDVRVKPIAAKLKSGTAQTYWDMMTDMAAPVMAALGNANEEVRQTIKDDVFSEVKKKFPGDVAFDAGALLISAIK